MRTYTITGCGQSPVETRFWLVASRVKRETAIELLDKLRAAVKGPKEHWGTNTLLEFDPAFPKTADRIAYDIHELDLDYTPVPSTAATSMSIVPLTRVGVEYRFVLDGTPVSLWEFTREIDLINDLMIDKELGVLATRGTATYDVRPVFITGG